MAENRLKHRVTITLHKVAIGNRSKQTKMKPFAQLCIHIATLWLLLPATMVKATEEKEKVTQLYSLITRGSRQWISSRKNRVTRFVPCLLLLHECRYTCNLSGANSRILLIHSQWPGMIWKLREIQSVYGFWFYVQTTPLVHGAQTFSNITKVFQQHSWVMTTLQSEAIKGSLRHATPAALVCVLFQGF